MTIVQEDNRKDEINFVRLLTRTEHMAKEKQGSFDWRLEKYVSTLTDSLKQLKKMSSNQPRHANLIDYTRRVDLLNGLLNSDRMSSTSLKSLALKQLVPSKECSERADDKEAMRATTPSSQGGRVKRFGGHSLGQQLLLETRTRLDGELRQELLGGGVGRGQLTHRTKQAKDQSTEGEGMKMEIVRDHERVQERLADDMVMLARSLKENASLAGRIVREDNERLTQSTAKTDENLSNLKRESDRLKQHARNACSCWVWLLLLIVVCTFILMVVFMRNFPKRM